MRSEEKNLVTGIIMVIFGFYMFYISGYSLFLFFSSLMLPIILRSIFRIKKFKNKFLYPFLLLSIFLTQGFLLCYICLFESGNLKNGVYLIIFLIFIAIFIFYIVSFVNSYRKQEYSNSMRG